MYEPYTNAPETTGIKTIDYAVLEKWVRGADAAGLQVHRRHCM